MTSMEKIILAVESTGGCSFTYKEICQALPEVPKGTVSSGLASLKKHRAIIPGEHRGAYIQTNPAKGIKLLELPKKEAKPATFEDLTLEEIEDILTYFRDDYLREKRDSKDIRAMLGRVFGEFTKSKEIPIGRRLLEEEK